MEDIENKKRLLVIWQDNKTRLRHIIGELTKGSCFMFQYNKENFQKLRSLDFNVLTAFPDWDKTYFSDTLFSVFLSRLPDKRRSDINNILRNYDLESYDEFDLLKKSGGRLPTDSLEFVEALDLSEKNIKRQFYIAGTKYYCGEDFCNILKLAPNEPLSFQLESDNKIDKNAVKILHLGTTIGYVPSYFAKEVTEAILSKRNVSIKVVETKPNFQLSENWYECVKVEITIEV